MSGPSGAHGEPRVRDPFAETAGAYVLGTLEREERAAFDEHLARCGACREAVDDVAHLPGLLAAVPPGGLADPPPSVLSGLLAAIADDDLTTRRTARRRRLWTGTGLVGAAAAGFVAAALVLPVGGGSQDDRPGGDLTSVALTTTATLPLSASVELEPVSWGTRLVVTCRYDEVGADAYAGPSAAPVEYALVVRDTDGAAQQVATWLAGPGDTLTVPAATALELHEIAALEMTSAGVVVLSSDV